MYEFKYKFFKKMLKWPKGITKDFGIWHSHWYHDIINSTEFSQTTNIIMNVPNEYQKIYEESLSIYGLKQIGKFLQILNI